MSKIILSRLGDDEQFIINPDDVESATMSYDFMFFNCTDEELDILKEKEEAHTVILTDTWFDGENLTKKSKLEELVKEYDYIQYESGEIENSDDIFNHDECLVYDYWDGDNYQQIIFGETSLDNITEYEYLFFTQTAYDEELEQYRVSKNCQYDVYINREKEEYMVAYSSYFQDCLDYPILITKDIKEVCKLLNLDEDDFDDI